MRKRIPRARAAAKKGLGWKHLVESARRAQKLAYCPYSRFPVGAAVLTAAGKVFTGANVENASYGLSLCAERVAIFRAVASGLREIKAVAVAAKLPRPCGACRQVMSEFSRPKTPVYLFKVAASKDGALRKTTVGSLIPHAFDPVESGLLPFDPRPEENPSPAETEGRRRRRKDGKPEA